MNPSAVDSLLVAISPAWLAAGLAAVAVVLLLVLLLRGPRLARLDPLLRDAYRELREAASRDAFELRDELAVNQDRANQALVTSVAELGRAQRDSLHALEQRLAQQVDRAERQHEQLRESVNRRVGEFQAGVDGQLTRMRELVEEKLEGTLERRLGESFRLVSERLESVQQGLGEMQTLAAGVGDLKRVLSNVKTRGTFGEVQLGALLAEILTASQYARNVNTRAGTDYRVEYAVRLPGGDGVWLPIDAKFPQEDYQRLLDASVAADAAAVEQSLAALVKAVKTAARDIATKYLDPPRTTDFALLFLPTEGLYAEVLRQPGLLETLQREERVVVTGPSTLAAVLSSLRMGFRTLAIEQRSSEVWNLLAGVKTEFERFGEQLARARRQLDLAGRAIDQTGTRTRAMARRLREVEHFDDGGADRPSPAASAGDGPDDADEAAMHEPWPDDQAANGSPPASDR